MSLTKLCIIVSLNLHVAIECFYFQVATKTNEFSQWNFYTPKRTRLFASSTDNGHNNSQEIINDSSSVMQTNDEAKEEEEEEEEEHYSKALFGMGCFWNPQEEISRLDGIKSVVSGYAQLSSSSLTNKPSSYFSVCNGDGRTEAVLIEYDTKKISYRDLLRLFWVAHDASTIYPSLSKQVQYKSVIWPLSAKQANIAQDEIQDALVSYKEMGRNKPQTVISKQVESILFYKAEGIHQYFWTKLQLKLLLVVLATILQESFNGTISGVVSPALIQAALIWILFEFLELVLSAFGVSKTIETL